MASVIFTGSHRVKSVVVITDKTVSPFWVFPYPILKCLLDDFLLRLCRRSFLCIEDTLNLRDTRIFDYVYDEHGNKKAVFNAKETTAAQAKQEVIKQAFHKEVA